MRSSEIKSTMIRPGPATGVVVSRSAPSIYIGCIPGVIDYRIIVVGIAGVGICGIDNRRRLCVIVGWIIIGWIIVGWISVGIGIPIAI